MKTLSQVCRIVGTTRKTLRGYDEIGLLRPTSKTENGYWLYDDPAISKLKFIQIFADAGYERSMIKEIVENPAADFLDEYDKVIKSLEERKQALTEQIRILTRLKLTVELPQKIDTAFKKTALKENILSMMQRLTAEKPQDIVDENEIVPFIYQLKVIGCLKKEDPSSASVQDLARNCCSYFSQIILTDKKPTGEGNTMSDLEASELIEEWLQNTLKEESAFTQYIGAESIDFILRAFRINTEKLR